MRGWRSCTWVEAIAGVHACMRARQPGYFRRRPLRAAYWVRAAGSLFDESARGMRCTIGAGTHRFEFRIGRAMPIDWNGTQASLLGPRFEHEPSVGFAIAKPEARLMSLAPVVRVARRTPTLAQSPSVDGLGNDFPNLPRHALAVSVLTMRH